MQLKKICPRCKAQMINANEKACPTCAAKVIDRHQEYDRFRRDQRASRFYHSKEWRHMRQHILQMYDHIDLYELYVNKRIVVANTVHHIVELSEDWSLRLTVDNLIPVSAATHALIDRLYRTDKKNTQQLLRICLYDYPGGPKKVL